MNIGGEIKLIIKEMKVGLLLGILYGILLGIFANILFSDAPGSLGIVVGLSICISMIVAATVGTVIPLILRKMDIDPAVATGPFVTTIIDILGVLFYFLIAGLFLSLYHELVSFIRNGFLFLFRSLNIFRFTIQKKDK